MLIDAARTCRHAVSKRWFVDETYVKVAGVWRYVYRAVDGYGQVIDVFVSVRRDVAAARKFFTTAIAAHGQPEEAATDRAAALANAIEELLPQGVAQHGQIREQPGRVRSRPVESEFAADARLEDRPNRDGDHHRSCVHPEPSPRSLRTRRRRPSKPSSLRCSVRRTRLDDLTRSAPTPVGRAPDRTTQQCRTTSVKSSVAVRRWRCDVSPLRMRGRRVRR